MASAIGHQIVEGKQMINKLQSITVLSGLSALLLVGCSREPTPEERSREKIAMHMAKAAQLMREDREGWFKGGTLQNSTLGDWRKSNNDNRLASAADFAAALVNRAGLELESMDDLRPIAEKLVECINEAGRNSKTDAIPVSDTAAACAVLMNL